MVRVMAERFNLSCERRRKLGVYEKAQSCAPQDGVIVLLGRELQDRGDVLGFKVGIVRQNLFGRGARSEQVQNVLHSNPEPTNARTATADIGIYCDPIEGAHRAIVARRRLPKRATRRCPNRNSGLFDLVEICRITGQGGETHFPMSYSVRTWNFR